MKKILQRDSYYSMNLLSAIKDYVVPEPDGHTTSDTLRSQAETKIFDILNESKSQDLAYNSIGNSHKACDTPVTQETTDSDAEFEKLFSLFEIYLKSDDGLVRKHSMILLGKVLSKSHTLKLSITNIQNLVSFCSKHLSDFFFVEGIVQVYLALFERHKTALNLGIIDNEIVPYERAEEPIDFFNESLENTKDTELSKKEIVKSFSTEPVSTTKETIVEKTTCVQVILDSILRDVHAPSFSQPIRYMIIKVIEFLLTHYSEYVRHRGGKVITRIFCQMENEKDPRNLMLNFPLIHLILKEYSDLLQGASGIDETLQQEDFEKTNHRLDMIADVLLSYFPIRFKPHHNEIYLVSEEELQDKLSKCFLTNALLATRLLDGCLDVLTDSIATDNIVDIKDSLNMFCDCIERFPELNVAGQYLKLLFDIIKLAAWHNSCRFLPYLSQTFARIADRVLMDCQSTSIVGTTLEPCIKLIFLFYEEYPGKYEYIAAKSLILKCIQKSVPLFLNVCEFLFSDMCLFSNHLKVLYQFKSECSTADCVTTNQKLANFETDDVVNLYSNYLDHLKFSREIIINVFRNVVENKQQVKCLLKGLKETYTVLLNIARGLTTNLLKESPEDSREFLVAYIELLSHVSTCVCLLMESDDHDKEDHMIDTILMFHAGIIGHFPTTNVENWVVDWFHYLDTLKKSPNSNFYLTTITSNFQRCCKCFPQKIENLLKENIIDFFKSSLSVISSQKDVYYSAILVASTLAQSLDVTQPTRITFLKLLLDNFLKTLRDSIILNSPTSAEKNYVYFFASNELMLNILDILQCQEIHSSFNEIEEVMYTWLLPDSPQRNILNTFFCHLCVLLSSSQLDKMDLIHLQNFVQNLILLFYLLLHYCHDINLLLHAIKSFIPQRLREWQTFNLSDIFTNSLVLLPALLFQLLYLDSLDKSLTNTNNDFFTILLKLGTFCASFVSRDLYSLKTTSNQNVSCFIEEIILCCYHEVLLLYFFFVRYDFELKIEEELKKSLNTSRACQINLATIQGYIGYIQILHAWKKGEESGALQCKDFLKKLINRDHDMSSTPDHIFFPAITFFASFCVQPCDDIPIYYRLDKSKKKLIMLDMLSFVQPHLTNFDFVSLVQKCFLPSRSYFFLFNRLNPLEHLMMDFEESSDPYKKTCLCSLVFIFIAMSKPFSFVDYIICSDFRFDFFNMVIWTLENPLMYSQKTLTTTSLAQVKDTVEYLAEKDRIAGSVTHFLLDVLTGLDTTGDIDLPTDLKTDSITIQNKLRSWCKRLFDSLQSLMSFTLNQLNNNSIPFIRFAAVKCLYLIGDAKEYAHLTKKNKAIMLFLLEKAKNDGYIFVRQGAAECVSTWSSI